MKEREDNAHLLNIQTIYQSLAELIDGLLLIDQNGQILQAPPAVRYLFNDPSRTERSPSLFQLDASLNSAGWRKWWKHLEKHRSAELPMRWAGRNGAQNTIQLLAVLPVAGISTIALCRLSFSDLDVVYPLLQSAARFSQVAAWEWDLKKESFVVTDHFYQLFELNPANYNPKRLNILELLRDRMTTGQLNEFTTGIRALRSQGMEFEQTLLLEWGDRQKQILFRADPIRENEEVVRIRGLVRELPLPDKLDRQAQAMLDKARSMICWVETDGYLVYVNAALCQALGYSREELLSSLTIHKLDIENSRSQWNSFRRVLEQESNLQLETSFQRKDGTIFPAEVTLIPLEQQLIGVLARDISSRRQEEMELKTGLLQINQLSRQLEAENLYLQEEVAHHFENIVSKSKAYAEVLHQVRQVAPTDSTVLIEGESGTGKELLAHAIHRLSQRSNRTLVKVNCAALQQSLIESELFGHEKGAFTGAERRRIGRFELADGGTIFLDEIGELPLDVQVKLLRVLQEGEFERVGGNTTLSVNVRIITATNRQLRDMVNKNKFREDLYYRLNVFPIDNIPLRQRSEDIPLLTQHFLQKYSLKIGKQITEIRPQDLKRLQQYEFPGNVRELENIIERAVILTQGHVLNLSYWKPQADIPVRDTAAAKTMEQMQYELIISTLEKTHWRVSGPEGAAELLDMHPQTLYSRMRKLGIRRSE